MGKIIHTWAAWGLCRSYALSEIKEAVNGPESTYYILHNAPSTKHKVVWNQKLFVEQFPMMPYYSDKYEELKKTKYLREFNKITQEIQVTNNKCDKMNQELQELRQENIKLLSHLEAIMIAIGNRSILADNIKL